ncbi:MAG: 2-oxo acid dehydrogenase subunit E2 [Chloroflexi bacterium]|nr:2-oxo acid dehydrogenase subunit E2 [Chloroflexota bacterium]
MATNVVMPQLGESVIEGTIGKWYKQVGDSIEQYESIMEVITDKVTTEIPSPASGTLLEIRVPEGATVNAGTILAVIGAADERVPSVPSVLSVPATSALATMPAATRATTSRLTPVVARMIAENKITDVELATIPGTGEGGRISKKDVEAFVARRSSASPMLPPSKPGNGNELPPWEQPGTGELFRPTEEVFGKPPPPAPPPSRTGEESEVVPLSPIRRAIAEHMVRSKQIAPHVTTVHEADMSRVMAYHKAHEAEFAKQGVKLTYTAFFVQAAIAALKAFPIVNASYTAQGIVLKRDVNIGIAVALDEGLIVPVVKRADEKSLLGIARAVNDLATRAREKRLQPDEVQGGTFTLTNYGVFGSLFGTPVINQPQSAIMGVGAIQKRAIVVNDAIAIRSMIYLALTFDHRLLDGAVGDQFMNRVKKFLEEHPEV